MVVLRKVNKPMRKLLFATLMIISSLSCSQSLKFKEADELGKEIFYLFKNEKKDVIANYLITKKEVRKVFSANKEYQRLSDTQKKELVNSSYDRIKKDAMTLIEYYTDKSYKETIALQKGDLVRVSSKSKNDSGPPAVKIEVSFLAEDQKYFLVLDASKIDDYWKLLSWIEVKKAFGE
jgi:hypothetical protein